MPFTLYGTDENFTKVNETTEECGELFVSSARTRPELL